ncbi:MAG: glycoside hydrolase family 25 protein [Erysipelotrichaceae bacterium]|nr:glycoside hydrolase family 25 protein [Erysipelotrichaceae bacterium]
MNNKKAFILLLAGLFLVTCLGTVLLLSDHDIPDDEAEKTDLYDYKLMDKDGLFYSYEDDRFTSLAGIDVSEHNDTVDFKKVRESGIGFVFIRIGWRGYTEGILHTDSAFMTNYRNAKDSGLLIGVYFFSQAINEEEATAEAELVLKTLDGLKIDLPVVYDFENIPDDVARTDGITKERCTKNAIAFMETAGRKYDVMLYANSDLIRNYYDMDVLKKYKLWFAQYNSVPVCDHDFSIWQYTNKGKVPGIDKETDLNIMFMEK